MTLLSVILSFPTAVYTVLLGLSVVYWLFVMIGALELDVLGGAEHALGGHGIDGHVDGAIDGHVDAAMDGHADGGADGGADAHHDGGDGHAQDHGDSDDGLFSSALAALKLRSAPVTVVASVFSLLGWLTSGFALLAIDGGGVVARLGVFAGSFVVSLLATSVVIRPLATIFNTKNSAVKHRDLIGKIVVVSTGSVSERFGQATLEETGRSLTLQVRADSSVGLKKGMRCVLVDHDAENETFSLEALPESEPRPRIDTSRALDRPPESEADSPGSSASEKQSDATRRA